jgi:hypothetical protein
MEFMCERRGQLEVGVITHARSEFPQAVTLIGRITRP